MLNRPHVEFTQGQVLPWRRIRLWLADKLASFAWMPQRTAPIY